MGEKTAVSKNNDCYFYYYSSCSKGSSCPFRHEPAALRNETMCIYWMQGTCNKANCIFRHMEITKQRDRIACWFESQPGGCKKPHCPFQHQNILDHPREEDIKKKPDLILPVKKEEEKKEAEIVLPPAAAAATTAVATAADAAAVAAVTVETERQVILPASVTAELTTLSRQPQFSTPIIVPLQDGESDSESVSGTPQKGVEPCPRLSAQMEWELRRLRQIQEHEANLIGYMIEEDEADQCDQGDQCNQGDQEEAKAVVDHKTQQDDEYVIEEVVEIDDNDATQRRLFPHASDLRSRLAARSFPKPASEDDLRHSILKHRSSPKQREAQARNKPPISARLGGLVGRTLAETLGITAPPRKLQIKRLSKRGDSTENVDIKSVALRIGDSKNIVSRLGGRLGHEAPRSNNRGDGVERVDALKPGDSKSVVSRLSGRLGQESPRGNTPEDRASPVDKPSSGRHGIKRGQQSDTTEDSVTHRISSPDTSVKKRISRGNLEKADTVQLDFTIKSLADIRAEKRKKSPSKKVQTFGVKNGTNVHTNEGKEVSSVKDEGEVRVLTLAEIRASKRQASVTSGSVAQQKRALSPITFTQNSSKKLKLESSKGIISQQSTNTTGDSSLINNSAERKITFSTRKIAINRSPVKVGECVSQTSEKEVAPSTAAELSTSTVQAKTSIVNTSLSHSEPVQVKSLRKSKKLSSSVCRPAPAILRSSSKTIFSENADSNSSISLAEAIPSVNASSNVSSSPAEAPPSTIASSDGSSSLVKATPSTSSSSNVSKSPTNAASSAKARNEVPRSPAVLSGSPNKVTSTVTKTNASCNALPVSRMDSLIDEEEALLLEGDMLELEDVDEDQLLL